MTDLTMPALSSIAPSPLWTRICQPSVRTLAVMGMTKNTGKTVAMNHVLAQAAAAHMTVGLSSIGRDGEDRDQVFFNPKPPLMVWPGQLVATARETLQRAKVSWKLIDSTNIDSPMGEILVVKILSYGEMEVAGASRGADQLNVIKRLRQCGANLVLLDGALGRSHHASPAIADGVVLATGAAIGGGVHDVIRKTRDRLAILSIAQASEDIRVQCTEIFERGGVGIWDCDGKCLFNDEIATLNAAATILRFIDFNIKTIAVSGAVGRQLWRALLEVAQRHSQLQVIVADGTKLFVENTDLINLQKLGGQVRGYRAIHLLGITLNPFSPMGGSFDALDFLTQAQHALAPFDVCDVILQAASNEKLKES